MDVAFERATAGRFADPEPLSMALGVSVELVTERETGARYIVKSYHKESLRKRRTYSPGRGYVRAITFYEFYWAQLPALRQLTADPGHHLMHVTEWFDVQEVNEELGIDYGHLYVLARHAGTPSSELAVSAPHAVLHRVKGIAIAIHTLHQQGWCHNDVKPSNVLVAGEVVVLGDFDLLNDRLVPGGTRQFRSPAYFVHDFSVGDQLVAGQREDWYALGVSACVWSGFELKADEPFAPDLASIADSTLKAVIEVLLAAPQSPGDVFQSLNDITCRSRE